MNEEIDTLTFEAALVELDEIVTRLEGSQLALEESLTLFERGQKLSDHCNQLLAQASLRVEQLTADGEIVVIEE